jgi:hypothetical protein
MRTRIANQDGAVLITFALLLVVLIGFSAIAMEAGRWYMIRAELSKSVDAGALAGAKNMGSPFVDPLVLAREFGQANFVAGYGGTEPLGTQGSVVFTASALPNNGIQVIGSVTALGYLSQLFGVNTVPITASGAARQNKAEIMLVLDRSGSMQGQPISDLKAGATNASDALAQAHGPSGLPDQTGMPDDQKVQQYVIFFTDGQPTALRGQFTYNGANYDGVAFSYSSSSVISDCYYIANTLLNPNIANDTGVPDVPTGDGVHGTKWQIMTKYPVPGYSPDFYGIPNTGWDALPNWFCQVARQLAINEAKIMKDQGALIYIIGLGNVDKNFLGQIASGASFEYYAPSSSDLQRIFNVIAKDIKLRLVQ